MACIFRESLRPQVNEAAVLAAGLRLRYAPSLAPDAIVTISGRTYALIMAPWASAGGPPDATGDRQRPASARDAAGTPDAAVAALVARLCDVSSSFRFTVLLLPHGLSTDPQILAAVHRQPVQSVVCAFLGLGDDPTTAALDLVAGLAQPALSADDVRAQWLEEAQSYDSFHRCLTSIPAAQLGSSHVEGMRVLGSIADVAACAPQDVAGVSGCAPRQALALAEFWGSSQVPPGGASQAVPGGGPGGGGAEAMPGGLWRPGY